MAAIAKFISHDGGLAFSESVVKFQKRDGEAKLIPVSSVASIGVRRPQQDADGFIRLQLTDGKRYRLFFAQDQLRDAVQFKKQFEAAFPEPPAPPAEDVLAEAAAPEVPEEPPVQEELPPEPETEPEPEPAPVSGRRAARRAREAAEPEPMEEEEQEPVPPAAGRRSGRRSRAMEELMEEAPAEEGYEAEEPAPARGRRRRVEAPLEEPPVREKKKTSAVSVLLFAIGIVLLLMAATVVALLVPRLMNRQPAGGGSDTPTPIDASARPAIVWVEDSAL